MRRSSLALVLVLAVMLLCLLAAPALAQTPPPPPTAVLTPTVVPTPTLTGSQLADVDEQVNRWQEILARYGPWGAVGLALIIFAIYLLSGYGEGLRDALKKIGERHAARPLEAVKAWQEHNQAARVYEDDAAQARGAYLTWLQDELHYLPQVPLKKDQPALALSDVYVPLRVVERQQIERFYAYMLGDHGDSGEYRARRDAFEAIEGSQRVYRLLSDRDCLPPSEEILTTRLLLVGDAGSGKTTTLYYGALILARDCAAGNSLLARSELGLYTHDRPIPIYVRLSWVLSDLRTSRPTPTPPLTGASAEHVIGFLERYVSGQVSTPLPPGTVSGWLVAGGCLVMLDGLDETGDAAERSYAKELVANLVQYRPNNRYIVASRPFEGVGLGLPEFLERRLSPMDEGEIRRLIDQWFGAAGRGERSRRPRTIQQQIDDLWQRLQATPRLFDMATNPLLLTSMAILVYGGDPLPPVRAQIYYELTRLTINRWREAQIQAGRLDDHNAAARRADERVRLYADESNDEVRRRLQTLAAAMLRLRRREVRLWEAQDIMAPIYTPDGWPRQKINDHVQALLYLLALHSGLIQERDQGYSFVHFTLQEYLAARDFDERDDVTSLFAQWSEPLWRETLLLAVGHWATDGQPQRAVLLLSQLLALDDVRALFLTAEALDEASAASVTSLRGHLDDVVLRLNAAAFNPTTMCADPALRAQAATLLDRLGADQRPALDPACPDFWAEKMTPGPFTMGEGNTSFTSRIRQPYALARFPVTNRLYLRFLETCNEADVERHRPRLWPGRRYRPGEGAYPVVGVTWENACAFAAWANTTFLSAEQRAAGEIVRLPTEPEWERAAAYPVVVPPGQPSLGRREYPWGQWPANLTDATDESIKRNIRANTQESGLKDTTPVGIFPHSMADCMAEELAGNVWEWCATAYQKYPLPDDLEAESIYTSQNWKQRTYVLRGGSYYGNRTDARCGARDHGYPNYGSVYFGFRLARLFSSESS